jgi:tetratricopeptide (TPR) repeat protein
VEDVTTDLARFSDILVISPHTAQALDADSLQNETAGGPRIDYALRGSIRRDAGKIRIVTQLVSPKDGRVAWAGRYDSALDRIFEIQDEIVRRVVAELSNRLNATMLAEARRKPVTELAAYEFWLRGYDQLREGNVAADQKARELFSRALDVDPTFPRAFVGLSLSYFNEWSCQLWSRWDENERNAYDYALRASELDDTDHLAQMVLGRVLLFRRQFDLAQQHIDRALMLNPNDADCLVKIATAKAYLGQKEVARQLYEKALALNPYRDNWYYAYGLLIAFMQERYEEAIELGSKTPSTIMVDFPAHLAATHYYLGHEDEARRYIGMYLEQFREKIAAGRNPEPGESLRWILHVNPYRDQADEDRLIAGVRGAGLGRDTTAATAESAGAETSFNLFRRVGELWQMSFEGRDVHLPEVKGFADLAALLARPGDELHCAELMGAVAAGDVDTVIDDKARAAYQERIRDLQAELEEAHKNHDRGRAEALREELDPIVEHLGKSLGLGGRSRRLGDPAERARSAVTWRIRSAIKKIEGAHPVLGRHLSNTIQTGTFCSYTPEKPLLWHL